MRLIPRVLLVSSMLAALLSGCKPAPTPALSAADQQAIRQVIESSMKMANSSPQDWVAYSKAYYAQDAIVNPPNTVPLKGQDAIVSLFKSLPPVKEFKDDVSEINGAGDFAYVCGNYTLVMEPVAGQEISEKGKYVEVWKRQANGSWKVAIDTFNSNLPVTGPEQK